METSALALYVFYFVVIAVGGIMAVGSASLVRALVGLILTLFGVAGMYLLMNAPYMAFMQLLIYVGAVVVLIFFAIMLARAPASGDEARPRQTRAALLALLGAALPVFAIAWVLFRHPPASVMVPPAVPLADLGKGLLGPYLLAFELISVVLFVAMAGAVLLAFNRRRSK